MATTIGSDAHALAATRAATRERYETLFSAGVWVRNLRELVPEGAARRRCSAPHRPGGVPALGGLYQFALQLG